MPVRFFIAAILCVSAYPCAQAQIAGDGSLGTLVGRSGNAWSISAGTRLGGNLFHSFSRFGVPTGNSATFSGPNSVVNIVGRVTGPDPSNIDGLLRSTIPGANLWLMNPKGVMFGPNASLDIGGSFHVTTADYLRLGNGPGIFHAALSATSTLSSAPPGAFGFLGAAPASITISGSRLTVLDGKEIAFVGGDLRMSDAVVTALGGSIQLASVASAAEVALKDGNIALTGRGAMGSIDLAHSLLNVSSVEYDIDGNMLRASNLPAGSIGIRGGRLAATGGSGLMANNFENGTSRGIQVYVDGDLLFDGSNIATDVYGGGAAGDIGIRADRVVISDGSWISSNSYGAGRGGSATILARGAVEIVGPSRVSTFGVGVGEAGSILIESGQVKVSGGGLIDAASYSSAPGGSVTIRAKGPVELGSSSNDFGSLTWGYISTAAFDSGAAGSILIAADRVAVRGGSAIDAGSRSSGHGGSVTIRTGGSVNVDGTDPSGFQISTISSSSSANGDGGSIEIEAKSVTLRDGGQIQASARSSGHAGSISVNVEDLITVGPPSPGGFFSVITSGSRLLSSDAGAAGSIEVNAGRVTLHGGGQIHSSTFGPGNAGAVTVKVRGTLEIRGAVLELLQPSFIGSNSLSSSVGAGQAGAVFVSARDIVLLDGGAIASSTRGPGNAGSVTVLAENSIRLSGGDPRQVSGIRTDSSSTDAASGNAGTVFITGREIEVSEDAVIRSRTLGGGAGGSVTVVADQIALSSGGLISASTRGSGNAGNVTVRAGRLVATGKGSTPDVFSGVFSFSRGSGNGGTVLVDASTVALADQAVIGSDAPAVGRAGDVIVRVSESLQLSGGARISTQASSGEGGNVTIQAGNLVYLRDSRITTSVGSGAGNGGNIFIDPQFVVLDNSQIIANAFGGNGGNISIVAGNFLSQGSVVQASSQLGISGNVQIAAPTTDVNSSLATLSAGYLDASSLIRASCAARAGGAAANSFMGVGRGGLAQAPGPGFALLSGAQAMGAPQGFFLSMRSAGCGG